MRNDWRPFIPERLEHLPAYTPNDAPGYLIWAKIASECLARGDLAGLLQHGCSDDPALDAQLTVAKERILLACRKLKARGITKVCTGVSWCDYACWPGGRAWIEWYLKEFAKDFEVLPRITFTPPPLTEDGGTINSPPRDPLLYVDFVRTFLDSYGSLFGGYIELWNEWNLDTDWKQSLDPNYRTFMVMIAAATLVVHHYGKKAVLGGMAGITPDNMRGMSNFAQHGLFRYVDVVGFHDLRGTWSDDIPSAPIPLQVEFVQDAMRTAPERHAWLASELERRTKGATSELAGILTTEQFKLRKQQELPKVWLTEYGFPVVCPEKRFATEYLEKIQTALFAYATDTIRSGAIERVYWYTFQDFEGESVRKHTTGWEDVLQFYYGDTCERGSPRLLATLLDEGGPEYVHGYALMHNLFMLVDAASLGRIRPEGYKSNKG